jgi:hypothetical protein
MNRAPELRIYMNLMALDSFPPSSGFSGGFQERMERLKEAGFSGVQFAEPGSAQQLACCRALRMGLAGSGRVNSAEEAARLAEQVAGDGYECATVHAGWGMEDDSEAGRLIEAILKASADWRIPLYIETHRATMFQDMWRTVQFAKRFPEIRFNGDFSHWYAGQEMVYGGFQKKLEFIQPVLDRVRFLHGRIANPGCIQVAVDEDAEPVYVEHFRQLWTASFRGFLQSGEGDFICFAPELLGPNIYYARKFDGMEETDRWQQSLVLANIAKGCFEAATRQM